jgi:hypothetical protein
MRGHEFMALKWRQFLLYMRTEWLTFQAQKAAANGRYRDARQLLRKVLELHGNKQPSDSVEPYTNLFFASVADNLGDSYSASQACITALRQLDSCDGRVWKYSPEDVRYLKYCCKLILSRSTNYVDSKEFSLAKEVKIDFSDLNTAGVQRRIARTFHIPEDVGKEYDEFVEQ